MFLAWLPVENPAEPMDADVAGEALTEEAFNAEPYFHDEVIQVYSPFGGGWLLGDSDSSRFVYESFEVTL